MAGRLLTSFCLGFLLLTQTCASPIPQSGSASSGAGQVVATSQDGTTGEAASSDPSSDGTTGDGASTGASTGTTGSTPNPEDTTSSSQSSGGATEAPSTSAGYTTSSPSSSEVATEAQTPPNGSGRGWRGLRDDCGEEQRLNASLIASQWHYGWMPFLTRGRLPHPSPTMSYLQSQDWRYLLLYNPKALTSVEETSACRDVPEMESVSSSST